MLRPTPRLPTASVVDRVFNNLGIEDDNAESVGEAFDPEGLTEAELIEAHYLGLVDLGSDTGTKKNAWQRAAAYVKPPNSGPGISVRGSAVNKQRAYKNWADMLGFTKPGVDSVDAIPRDYGLKGYGDYSPAKASNTTGDGDLALTYAERMVTRLMALQMMVPDEMARYNQLGPVFSSTSGWITGPDMATALSKMNDRFTLHLAWWTSQVVPARATRGSTTFDEMDRVARVLARGGTYKVKGQNYTTFENAVRWAAAHPEIFLP